MKRRPTLRHGDACDLTCSLVRAQPSLGFLVGEGHQPSTNSKRKERERERGSSALKNFTEILESDNQERKHEGIVVTAVYCCFFQCLELLQLRIQPWDNLSCMSGGQ